MDKYLKLTGLLACIACAATAIDFALGNQHILPANLAWLWWFAVLVWVHGAVEFFEA